MREFGQCGSAERAKSVLKNRRVRGNRDLRSHNFSERDVRAEHSLGHYSLGASFTPLLPSPMSPALTDETICRKINVRMSDTTFEIENLAQLDEMPQDDLIRAISAGLPAHLARELARSLEITLDDIAGLLRMNPRTLQRRLSERSLDLSESERLWQISRLFHRAEEVLESRAGALHWFKNPIEALGWATPLAYARTAVGLRELENILGRIEHGVYS